MEYNLVEQWLRKDPMRWISGALAGVLAGAIAMVAAGMIASQSGLEFLFPLKLIGTIPLGAQATELGFTPGAIAGGVVLGILCSVLGMIYSHFVFSNSLDALLAMGLVWGSFSWIFIWNLFMPSFRTIFNAHASSGVAFFICLLFGSSLSSVKLFYRALKS
ncbi:MAG: hypothetical protein ACO3A2_01015 [Bdellovibrionia bacterium]